jgi:hypothetical protein
VDAVSRLNIYIHSPRYSANDEFTWETFLRAGSDLAEDLAMLSAEVCASSSSSLFSVYKTILIPQQNSKHPIIFIAHSLGGVLLKQVWSQSSVYTIPGTNDLQRLFCSPMKIYKIRGSRWFLNVYLEYCSLGHHTRV